MNNLITPQEAFNAMVAGKNILCRAVGELIDFNDIDQFPATIFAKTGYEFCIKLDMIEVAGITFTKPLTLEEIQDGQDLFVINTYGSSIYVVSFTCTALVDSINSGFVQRDAENAKLHLQAISKLMGRELPLDISVVRLGDEKPKAARKTKAKAPTPTVENVQIAASNDAVEKTSQSSIQITAVDKTVIQEDNLVAFDDAKNRFNHEKSLRDRIAATESIGDLEALLPELQQLHGESGHLIMSQYENHKESLSISELRRLTLEAEAVLSAPVEVETKNKEALDDLTKKINTAMTLLDLEKALPALHAYIDGVPRHFLLGFYERREEEIKRIELLNDLLSRAATSQTPVEANALVTYTRSWTEEQRKPLLVAINKRLIELAPIEVEVPPTLMDRIKSAVDLTTLDVLEVDVGARSPEMQPKFMAEIVKRRRDLESQGVA